MPKIFNTIFIHVGGNTTIKYFKSLKIFLKHRIILKIFFPKYESMVFEGNARKMCM